MNKADRVRLLEAIGSAQDAFNIVEELAEAEREKFGNMSEGLQNGEKGQAISDAADALESAKDQLESAISDLEGIS